MKITKKAFFFVCVGTLFIYVASYAATNVGNNGKSDGSIFGVTREANQNIDVNTTIFGFAWLFDGFSIGTPEEVGYLVNFDSVFPIGSSAHINNGRILGQQDMYFTGTGGILHEGILATSSCVHLNSTEHTETATMLWDGMGTGATIHLHAPTSLSSTWTFSGMITMQGNGHEFSITDHPASVIEVEHGSNITFCNMTLGGLKENKLICHGSAASVTFNNVDVRLSGNYSLTGAALKVKNDMRIFGKDHIFTYTAPYQGEVKSCSCLYIDHGVTFSYDSSFVGNVADQKSRISFADETSVLHINGGTLHVTLTGFAMMTGTLLLENDAVLDIDGIEDHQVMELSDNVGTKILGDGAINIRGKLKYV